VNGSLASRPFRFGVVVAQARSGDELAAWARRVEGLGYSSWLMPDTLGQTLAPLPALAAAAAATRSLRVGTFVLANDFRNPVLLARESATLDFLSNGRFELGLGAGRPAAESDARKLGIPFESGGSRVDRLAEALGIISALLSGERATATGPHYAAVDADVFPPPAQLPHPPILVAGSGRRLLSLAGRKADIVALGAGPSASQQDLAEKVGWVREAAGERFKELELNLNLVAVGDEADPMVRARFGLSFEDLVRAGSPFVLVGTPDEMCEQLLRRREALGTSYVTVGQAFFESFAPAVERLAGR
jgi:probable F420-dependent oxidoreductase